MEASCLQIHYTGKECQYLVELADDRGAEYAMTVLKADEIN